MIMCEGEKKSNFGSFIFGNQSIKLSKKFSGFHNRLLVDNKFGKFLLGLFWYKIISGIS